MKKKPSKLKRMLVKGIFYDGNNIKIISSLNENNLIHVEYENIDDMLKLRSNEIIDNQTPHNKLPGFSNIDEERGFTLKSHIDLNNKLRISNVKNEYPSIIRQELKIENENNIDIQIVHNIFDIKKILSEMANNVIYSVATTLYKKNKNDLNDYKDVISNIPSYIELSNYDFVKAKDVNKEKLANICFLSKDLIDKLFPKKENINDVLLSIIKKENKYIVINKKTNKIATENLLNSHIKDLSHDDVFKSISNIKFSSLRFDIMKAYKIKKLGECILNNYVLLDMEYYYDFLRLISQFRQATVHSNQNLIIVDNKCKDIINEKLNCFANGFEEKNYKYFEILNRLGLINKREEFKDFIIFDRCKNLGISIKKIKFLIDCNNKELLENKNSEFFSKYANIVSFMIYLYFEGNKEKRDYYVEKLKTEADKDSVYVCCYNDIIKNIDLPKIIHTITNVIKDNKKLNNNKFNKSSNNYFKEYLSFSILLFYNSMFITKNQANDVISRLINKFESIQSLRRISENKINFEYNKYSNCLEEIKDDNVLTILINELYEIKAIRLKLNNSIVECNEKDIMEIMDSIVSHDIAIDKDMLNEQLKGKKEKPFKNYMRNNIYPSKQYQYIKEYCNVSICKDIVQNKDIVSFVINELSKNEEMVKYLEKVYCNFNKISSSSDPLDKKKEKLINEICSVDQLKLYNSVFNKEKYDYREIIKLYYNVCYLFIKKMVMYNTSYYVAFSEYEELFCKKNNINNNKKFDSYGKICFVEDFKNTLRQRGKESKTLKYLDKLGNQDIYKNYEKDSQALIKEYRNKIEHISFIQESNVLNKICKPTSYYAMFQCLIQNTLINSKKIPDNVINEFELDKITSKEKPYSKRFTVYLNYSFAYNMARFNNITVEKYAEKKLKQEE